MTVAISNCRACWQVPLAAAALLAISCGGCSACRTVASALVHDTPAAVEAPWDNSRLMLAERLSQGYVLVLPGVWGDWQVDHRIALGLADANPPAAIESYDWTSGALRMYDNLRNFERNQAEARKLAAKIVLYQQRFSRRPVHVVGYSAGGALAVLVLENLPPACAVTSAVLLAPTLAPEYDLRPALAHTQAGIHNFYSPWDPAVLVFAAAFGTTEGRHGPAAGALGFVPPEALGEHDRQQYHARVTQHGYELAMLSDGHTGGHFGWASRTFVTRRIAPLIAQPHHELAHSPPLDGATARR